MTRVRPVRTNDLGVISSTAAQQAGEAQQTLGLAPYPRRLLRVSSASARSPLHRKHYRHSGDGVSRHAPTAADPSGNTSKQQDQDSARQIMTEIGHDRHPSPETLQGVNRLRTCSGCDRQFRPRRRDQRYCRPSCRVLAYRRRKPRSESVPASKPCPHCGEQRMTEFDPVHPLLFLQRLRIHMAPVVDDATARRDLALMTEALGSSRLSPAPRAALIRRYFESPLPHHSTRSWRASHHVECPERVLGRPKAGQVRVEGFAHIMPTMASSSRDALRLLATLRRQ